MLNKIDIGSPKDIAAARAIFRSLNADAKIIETSHARVASRRAKSSTRVFLISTPLIVIRPGTKS